MKFNYDIKFTDNTPQLHEALDSWAERVLTIWGMKVQDYAQLLVPTGTADSTGIEGYVGGALKQSLTYAVDLAKKTVTIGSNLFTASMWSWERASLPRRATDEKRRGSGRTSTVDGTFTRGNGSPPVSPPGGGKTH